MENPYALLNYNMENNTETPEFKAATDYITKVIAEMTDGIKADQTDISAEEISRCFYHNLHWGSISARVLCGNTKVDDLIKTAVDSLVEFGDGDTDDGGIGDTATDESIAYTVEELLEKVEKTS